MTDDKTKGRGGRAEVGERDVERMLRSGQRLSAVFGRHVPRLFKREVLAAFEEEETNNG